MARDRTGDDLDTFDASLFPPAPVWLPKALKRHSGGRPRRKPGDACQLCGGRGYIITYGKPGDLETGQGEDCPECKEW